MAKTVYMTVLKVLNKWVERMQRCEACTGLLSEISQYSKFCWGDELGSAGRPEGWTAGAGPF